MKAKARFISIVFLVLVLYLYISGYKFTPRQAANAHYFLERDSQVISEVDVFYNFYIMLICMTYKLRRISKII